MKVFRTIQGIKRHIDKKKASKASIGFVPTMGYIHKGHLSLIKAARRQNDIVVMSIFVNPAQFGPKEDYMRYPRDLRRDEKLAKAEGADAIFYPSVEMMYPRGYRTYVDVKDITDKLCGESRPGHFRGVATVVAKLFNIVSPDRAYFGQKDAQQVIVIKRMVKDLNMDIHIMAMPTIRERDGLAMSSRNVYLSKRERQDALVLHESLDLAKDMIGSGVRDAKKVKSSMEKLINSKETARVDYISISDITDLREVRSVGKDALIALAARIGKTRLIDNIVIGKW
ncbi:MAG: pantoate--beta-alanine ligase [Candidatus Omnitrophota bacterium]